MSQRRSQRKRKQDNKGLFIVFICSVIFISIGLGVYIQNKNLQVRDKITQCREDGFVAQETALIFDATDSFSMTQAILINNKIEKLIMESPIDEKFTLFVLGNEKDNFKAEFSVCNPGDGSEKSELVANVRRLKMLWQQNFNNKISKAINKLTGENSATASPIMEMIKFASVHTIAPSIARVKRLILVSDMIHHTDRFSYYKNQVSFDSIKNTPYITQLQSHLTDTMVEIMYVTREKNITIQNRRHILFWEQYIANSGGQIVKVERIN